MTISRCMLGLVALAAAGVRPAAGQETATWYIPTYTQEMLVWDEASERIIDRIQMEHFIPNEVSLNEAGDRLYVLDATAEHIDVVDIAARRVVDTFTLSSGSTTVRIDTYAVHPSDERMVLVAKRSTKGRDRYSVEGPFVLEYDLRAKQVTDTLDWPDGLDRDRGGSFRYAPDGETLYFVAGDVIAVDADSYEEVDRWELSQPLEPGLGRQNFNLESGTYDEPGVATGLYRMTDPVQNRGMLGIARVRLEDREVESYPLGTSEPVSRFALAPGGQRGYALYSEIGRYEFWEFDLGDRRLVRREAFDGRPRMGLQVSADGEKLYVHVAGNTIDVYDAGTFEFMRAITFDADMTLGNVVVIPGPAAGP